MSIKLIAVDMDHTFLRADKSFDLPRFEKLFEKMEQQDIRFVVASGGQLQRLQGYFPPHIREKITFIAENGAWIIEQDQEVAASVIPFASMLQATEQLEQIDDIYINVCGKKATYVLDTVSLESFNQILKFCPVLKRVPNYQTIDDDILKISIKNKILSTEKAMELIAEVVTNQFVATPSGHISIDVTLPDAHKGSALAYVCQKYAIPAEACIAFGDNENDRTMLAYVGRGYVMENAKKTLFDVSPLRAPSNELQGVLTVLETLL